MSYANGPTGPNGPNGPTGPIGPNGSPPPGWTPPTGGNPFSEHAAGGGQPGGSRFPPPGYPPPPTAVDPALRIVVPIGVSPWAIASGYLGLLSFLCGVTGPFALLTGILALRQIKKDPQLGGHVRAWVGIVLGTLGTLGLIGFLVALLLG
ncbi:MAG: hypothetical protein RLY70_2488 [Planctomycetota bacterium]